MKKNTLTKKLIYLDLSILDINKISMYQFWYDNINKPEKKQDYATGIQVTS